MLYWIKNTCLFLNFCFGQTLPLHAFACWQSTPTAADRSCNAQSITTICLIHSGLGVSRVLPLNAGGLPLPNWPHPPNSDFRSHVSSLVGATSPVSCIFPFAKRPREGRSIEPRRADHKRLLCQSHTKARQILVIGTAGMLIHPVCMINGAEVLLFSDVCAICKMEATQNMCVPLGWSVLQRANERARYIHENQARHALLWLHKRLFFLLAFNDVGPNP